MVVRGTTGRFAGTAAFWAPSPGIVFLVLLVAMVILNLAVALAEHHAGLQTGLWDLHFWATWPGGHTPSWMTVDDSWMPMRKAYAWISHPHHGQLYREIFFTQHVKFQYPPTSLLIFAIPDALHISMPNRLLNGVGWFAVVGEGVATGWLALLALRQQASGRLSPRLNLVCAVAIGLTVFTFHSVLWAFSLGQVQAWLNACFAFAAVAWLSGRQRTAGVLIGVICLFKPQFGLFLLWALLRGQWRFLTGLAIVVTTGLGLSLMWFGFANHIDYLSAISFMNAHGEAFYPNSSVNGVLNRLLGNADSFTVDKTAFPPFNPIIYYVSSVTSAALVLLALLFRRKQAVDLADLLAAGIIFTIASPIAWVHHLGILPPAFAVLTVRLIATPSRASTAAIYAAAVAIAYLMSSIFVPPLTWCGSGLTSLIYSLPLWGALVCMVLLFRLDAKAAAVATPTKYDEQALLS